jgi:biofilm PGA synthesis N-glycosyltransferase PgaC
MHWLPTIVILPYIIILLKIHRSLLKAETFSVSTDPVTFVSVVVACRDEQKNLPALLTHISLQNYPSDLFEVIIVNDSSTDKTVEVAIGFSGIRNINILKNKGEGKKQALRTGISASKGNLIITTDADCRMGIDWIRTIASFYEINKPDMIICPVQIEPVTGIFGRFQELEFISLQGITAGSSLSGEATMCNGANLAFKKEVYLDHTANLHDEIYSGDDIFFLQSLKRDDRSKILWLESQNAIVTTTSSSTHGSFLKQRSRWISKAKAYKDRDTIILGIVVFTAIILQISYLIACLINQTLIIVSLSVFVVKSIPDYVILINTTRRYGRKKLMWWFLPTQLMYPFYVLSVVLYSLISRNK